MLVNRRASRGFGRVENNLDLHMQKLDFLDIHIGPKSKR